METRRFRGVFALSATVAIVAAALAIASPKPPAPQRVPCLDGSSILSWIDGRRVVVCVEAKDGPFQAWLHRLMKRPQVRWDLRRVSLADGAARTLLSVTEKVHRFSLAPDGRSLVYWRGHDEGGWKGVAYRVEVR